MEWLKSFLFKRPEWFSHEGYWRVSQIFRIGVPALLFCLAVLMLFSPSESERMFGPFLFSCAAVVSIVIIHFALQLIVWVVEGFIDGDS
ncbi:hypothetical protein [Pseudomonas aeruginosa]|uniref:hypothetical protein n=1 Tax=Pseudomonas aeruginosa TaxID=287 RepID=UPI000F54434F|nr:hypothetical protein [Pseudomonas aeruginosa]